MENRERLGSRLGFIMLSAGCAIGCGNVWKFPWMCGQYGGGGFMLVYLICLVLLGMPALVMEFSAGRAAQTSPIYMYQKLAKPGTKWGAWGYISLIGNISLMAFYCVVTGWILYYFFRFSTGSFDSLGFVPMITNPGVNVIFLLVTVAAAFFILSFNLQGGLERVTKFMMSALLGLLLVLAVHSLLLPGAGEGLKFYLVPDLSKINGSSRAQQILQNIKETMTEKTERLMTYGALCIFVGIMLSVFQQAVGINAVLYYAPRIFGDMGMENPMMVTVFMGVINILFTLVAIFTVEKWGRKPLLIYGSLGMALGAFGVAITFGHAGLEMVTALSIMIYSASFMFSWGPITWVLIAEIFPNTIRGAAVAIAVAFQWIFNFIVSSTFVPMFNMHLSEGDDFGHWFTYGLYGVICLIAALFVWRLVPETKGKTLEDMSKLWKSRL